MFSALQSAPDERREHWMREALRAAYEARDRDEVPVGTCVVVAGELLAVAGNRTRTDCDPTAHAEIVALREAARKFEARVKGLVYGATDEKAGAVESHFHICDAGQLNHRVEIVKGILEAECRALMQDFFRDRR